MSPKETTAALNQIWECIYDHGNGKTEGALSKFQRVLAFKAIIALREELATNAQERERILAAASDACRPFGKTGAVVMCAIRSKIDQVKEEK